MSKNSPQAGDVAQYGAQILDHLGDKIAGPDPFAEQINAAWQLHLNNKDEQAPAEFDKILQQDPNHLDALYGKGLALRSLGRTEDAVAVFQKMIGLIDNIRADMPGRSTILERMAKRQIEWMQQS